MTTPVSESPIHPIQVAVYRLLSEDETLLDLAPGGVHDEVPETQVMPWIRIGDHLSIPDNAHGQFGRQITETVHVWTRRRGNATGQAIAARVGELLDHQAAALQAAGADDLDGHVIVSVRQEYDQALVDPDPQIRHHVLRFRIITAQQEG